MIGVCLSGAAGRIGRMLADLIRESNGLRLVAALERSDHPDLGSPIAKNVTLGDAAELAIAVSDVLLDFGPPDIVIEHVELAVQQGKPVVTGTTGFSEAQLKKLRAAGESVPLVCSSNMSRGVYWVTELTRQAARMLKDYDAEILELHHRHKADAPSGTALLLAEAVAQASQRTQRAYGRKGKRKDGEIGLAAIRGGDVVGEHQVMFLGPGEQIIITHRATSREHFCRGALEAVRFVVGRKPGYYSMADVFTEASS
jgi:4-hydroxy-tetrahydrodipicolinate reductase